VRKSPKNTQKTAGWLTKPTPRSAERAWVLLPPCGREACDRGAIREGDVSGKRGKTPDQRTDKKRLSLSSKPGPSTEALIRGKKPNGDHEGEKGKLQKRLSRLFRAHGRCNLTLKEEKLRDIEREKRGGGRRAPSAPSNGTGKGVPHQTRRRGKKKKPPRPPGKIDPQGGPPPVCPQTRDRHAWNRKKKTENESTGLAGDDTRLMCCCQDKALEADSQKYWRGNNDGGEDP